MNARRILMAATLMLLPVSLQGQGAEGSADARVAAAMSTAIEAGIPVSLLESKVAEGRAKGVPMERIAAAVEARLDALTRASSLLAGPDRGADRRPDAAELSVAADALQGGVSAEALASIHSTAPRERRNVAVAVLTQLVQMGYASENALIHVNAALARGPEALANLPARAAAAIRVQGGVRGGGPPPLDVLPGGPDGGIPLPGRTRGRSGAGAGSGG